MPKLKQVWIILMNISILQQIELGIFESLTLSAVVKSLCVAKQNIRKKDSFFFPPDKNNFSLCSRS